MISAPYRCLSVVLPALLLTVFFWGSPCPAQTAEAAPTATPGAAASVPGMPRVDTGDLELRELRPGVWLHTSYFMHPLGGRFSANGLVVKEGEGLVLVDTAWGEMLTAVLLERIRQDIGLPVRRAVLTHAHYDRSAGADVLEAANIPVFAHPRTRELTAGHGTPTPQEIFPALETEGSAVRLGALEIFYPGPAHAEDNLVVWIPEARLLFGGCAVRSGTARNLGNLADADLEAWPRSLGRVVERYGEIETVVPGHGKVGGPELLQHTLGLLERQSPAE